MESFPSCETIFTSINAYRLRCSHSRQVLDYFAKRYWLFSRKKSLRIYWKNCESDSGYASRLRRDYKHTPIGLTIFATVTKAASSAEYSHFMLIFVFWEAKGIFSANNYFLKRLILTDAMRFSIKIKINLWRNFTATAASRAANICCIETLDAKKIIYVRSFAQLLPSPR